MAKNKQILSSMSSMDNSSSMSSDISDVKSNSPSATSSSSTSLIQPINYESTDYNDNITTRINSMDTNIISNSIKNDQSKDDSKISFELFQSGINKNLKNDIIDFNNKKVTVRGKSNGFLKKYEYGQIKDENGKLIYPRKKPEHLIEDIENVDVFEILGNNPEAEELYDFYCEVEWLSEDLTNYLDVKFSLLDDMELEAYIMDMGPVIIELAELLELNDSNLIEWQILELESLIHELV